MELKRKNVIVTGAASGVGKELTKQLLAKGCKVAGVDISGDNLKKLEEELNNPNLKTYTLDVSSEEAILAFRDRYHEDYHDVDVIINNAGIIQPFTKVQHLDDNTIHRVMDVNFFGPLNLIRFFMDDLTKDRKEQYIVNVSSMGGFFPFPGQTVYGASKAALKILTEGLYAELADTNVRVMIVLPGAMDTNITENSGVSMGTTSSKEDSPMKLLSAEDAAAQIIKGMEKNKFKLFVGQDSKFLRFLYKWNDKKAIKFINDKMKNM